MLKTIVKINIHTAQPISNLTFQEFWKEAEVTKLRNERKREHNNSQTLFDDSRIFESESYLYVSVRKKEGYGKEEI